MTEIVEGSLEGSGLHIGIVAAQWNQAITDRLLEGALIRAEELGVSKVTAMRVPGALELPVAAQRLAQIGCDAVVAIGTVVKGETDHYDIVVNESARGINLVALETGVPITNAILAVHDYSHAVDRAGIGDSNKGHEAVEAAVITANALRRVGGT
ncbi:MAG TPA: 6,7-dimethyl-8-ribityllumazine synthase [Acidimicrobiia bacterium]|nr:6,7-dimethyl-8-ribityllumazine synthase [Acidimicrobiia bacterium]